MKIPNNYFQQSKEHILDEIALRSMFGKTSNPFVVPNGYFEKCKREIIRKTTENQSKKRFLLYPYGIAASFIFLLGMLGWYHYSLSYNNSLTASELQAYLGENYNNLYWLTENIDADNLDTTMEVGTNEEQLETYLEEYLYLEDLP